MSPCATRHMTEKHFQQAIIEAAHLLGWITYHTYDSRRCVPGYPDLMLCKPPSIVFAELKVGRNRLTEAQRQWMEKIRACGIECHIWKPDMMDEILTRLQT